MNAELIVDSFAGGGGASLGITLALGRGPDIAINHDTAAIAMHRANHPHAKHFTEDVWKISPRKVTRGRPVGLLWASPDCRHFSRAKGAKPVEKRIRSLAWVVIKWAIEVQPRLIILENVREFEDWGPLVPQWRCQGCDWKGTEGQAVLCRKRRRCPRCESLRLLETIDQVPDPTKKGLTFKRWTGRLRNLGYAIEWRNLNAADYGAPTHRRRLFLVARCDGLPIVWPEPTHADPRRLDDTPLFGRTLQPYRTAAECIDWSLACPSIFERERPLAEKTLRRIALGLQRYVIDNPHPFIVPVTHAGERRSHGVDEPLPPVTGANRGELAFVSPTLVGVGGADYAGKPRPVDQPKGVVMPNDRTAVVAPTLIQTGYGERDGQQPRAIDIGKPLGTVVAGGQKHALVAATIAKFYGGVVGHGMDKPIGTVTACDHHGLVSAALIGVGGRAGQSPPTATDEPLRTVTAKGDRALVAAHLVKFRGDSKGSAADEPTPTITSGQGAARPAGAPHALGIAAAYLARFNHGDKQWSGIDEPVGTVTSQGNKFGLCYAFLVKYLGTCIGQTLTEPMHTATAKHRFGLVYIEVAPGCNEPAVALFVPGIGLCVVADIGLRMLQPHELARAQGFPDTYQLVGSKSKRVALIGNSVPPVMPRMLVEANYAAELCAV